MASVFISYAREDKDQAAALAKAIEAQGFNVWWDRELLAGDTYVDVIEKVLDEAAAVIVVWSQNSRKSHWVRDEAAVGRDRNRLVPVSMDGLAPPLGFRQIHTTSLEGWNGDAAALSSLWPSLTALTGGDGPDTAPAAAAPRADDTSGRFVAGLTAAPNQKSVKTILKEEKRQRSFLSTFWITSFIVSGALSVLIAFTTSITDAETDIASQVGYRIGYLIAAFFVVSVLLMLGRFFIVLGRRLSKRKSVKYFDSPTIIAGLISAGITSLALLDPEYVAGDDAVAGVLVTSAMIFVFVALVSIPIGFFRGLGRKGFQDGT